MGKKWVATSLLIGAIIGAGVFGIPYVVSETGFVPGLILIIVIGVAVLFVNLYYGEIIADQKKDYQFVQHSRWILGRKGGALALIAILFNLFGALLAYIIQAGVFLENLLGPLLGGNDFAYSVIFFFLGSVAVLAGLKKIGIFELIFSFLIGAIIIVVFFIGIPEMELANLADAPLRGLPVAYGVILFAMGGMTAIPEVRRVLGDNRGLRSAVIWGTILPIILFCLFALTSVAVLGRGISSDPFQDLGQVLGPAVTFLGSIFGLLAITTSFFVVGFVVKEVFRRDLGFNNLFAWLIAMFAPFLLFVVGVRDFVGVIGLVGVVSGSILGFMLVYMHQVRSGQQLENPVFRLRSRLLRFFIYLVFAVGLLFSIVDFFLVL